MWSMHGILLASIWTHKNLVEDKSDQEIQEFIVLEWKVYSVNWVLGSGLGVKD